MCAADVAAIMAGRPRPMPQPPGANGGPPAASAAAPAAAAGSAAAPAAYPSAGPGWLCLYVRCDAAPPEFDAAARLRGPGGGYLQHIQAATGAAAVVAGRGSGSGGGGAGEGPEPLHIRLTCHDAAKLEEGRK
jgi:hypothetical protein